MESAIWLLGGAILGLVVHPVLFGLLRAALRRSGGRDDRRLDAVRRLEAPARVVLPLASLLWALRLADLDPAAEATVRHGLAILLIAAASWLLVRTIAVVVELVLKRHDVSERDNLEARSIHTLLRVVTRIAYVVVWSLGVAAILMTFPSVRQVGASILASAGILGLVVGLAAQRTIGNFLAGIQIAITQPIRLDDAVVIAGEWGWVEEIPSTYVVVKIWDERRLVVPFATLLEQPFQNWTRQTSQLLGQVTLWVDYRVPVQALREELQRIVEGTELWDRRVAVLQVVDASERALALRALVSAADSPTTWDLRCHVRERLVDFLRRHHPEALPTLRAIVDGDPADVPASEARGSSVETGGLPGGPATAGD